MRTPQTITVVIPAGDVGVIVPFSGKWFRIIDSNAASLLVAFEQEQPQQMFKGLDYPCGTGQFSFVRLVDTTGAGCWATVTISVEQLHGQALVLASATRAQLADTVCPVAPGAGVQLFAADPARAIVEISSPPKNGAGLIYLGTTAARCTAVDNFKVLRAGESWWDAESGPIFGASSTGAEVVNGRTR